MQLYGVFVGLTGFKQTIQYTTTCITLVLVIIFDVAHTRAGDSAQH